MRILTPTIAVAIVLAISGCSPTPPPGITPEAPPSSATPGSDPTPAEPDIPESVSLSITTRALNELDAEGNYTRGYEFLTDSEAAIAGLTELFGSEPVVDSFEGGNHSWPGNYYTWGGFVLIDWIGGPGIPYGEDFAVRITSSNEGGVPIATEEGFTIGTPAATIASTGATGGTFDWDDEIYTWLEIDNLDVDNEFDNAQVFVRAVLDGEGGPVKELVAPSANFGP